ncbi:MAG: TerL [Pseudomonadota bacterium]
MGLIEFSYRPQGPTLEAYILDREQRTFICGPLGSSKTNASCWKSFRVMCAQAPDQNGIRKTRLAAIRNTYPDLMGTTVKDWLEMFDDLGTFKGAGVEPPTHRLRFELPDGTRVEAEMVFLALDREEHVRKLRGLQLTAAWLNEVKELPFAVVQMLDLRVGRYPQDTRPTWYGIYGDTNAPDTDHWYYRLAEEQRPEGWTFLKQPGGLIRDGKDAPWRENPLAENVQNLPAGYYIKGAQGKDEAWILVNLANEYGFVKDGKPVWPDYRDSTHCRQFELVKELGLHIGMDFGLTPAAVFGQRMVNGQWRWRRELVTEDTGIIRFAGEVKLFLGAHFPGWPIQSITGDPAGDQRQGGDSEERTVFQLLAKEGIGAVPAPTNDFALRTEAVAAPLRRMIDGEPGFLIHPDCQITRKGMQGGYMFKRIKVAGDERYRDVPDKNKYSHPCEAGQYLMLSSGEHLDLMPKKQVVAVTPIPMSSAWKRK